MDYNTIYYGKYKVEPLSAATIQGALRIIKESFCQDEIVCIGTEINKNEKAAEELLELCADVALDGVSLVAVLVTTGEVASVIFNKLQTATTESSTKSFFQIFSEERCTHPSSRALIEFMAVQDERCNFFEKFGVDCSFEVMFLSTLPEHRHNKLGMILATKSFELAKSLKYGPVSAMTVEDLGPKYAFIPNRKAVNKIPKFCHALCTSEASMKIGKALGFNVYLRFPFSECYFNGKSYTERIGAETWCEALGLSIKE